MLDHGAGNPGSIPTYTSFFLSTMSVVALQVSMFIFFFGLRIIFPFFLHSYTFENERGAVGFSV
jgi:hypothetical protein